MVHQVMPITLSIINGFLKFFHWYTLCGKFAIKFLLKIRPIFRMAFGAAKNKTLVQERFSAQE